MNSETIPHVDGQLLVGLTIDEAKNRYPEILIRSSKMDGKAQILHYNYCLNRYNVEIENNIITKYGSNY
jgi:hypothetical protein